jgi:hypothetical protein
VDLSPLIFVALAVAWAVYLVPKALKHHDEVVRSRSVEKFSHTMRVLARREPVTGRNARLVVSPSRAAARPPVETKARTAPAPESVAAPVAPRPVAPRPAVTRASARRAARRRRNVLALVLLANTVVVGLAVAKVVAWPWVAAPAGLLVAWLVACRLSVKAERRARRALRSAIEVGVPPELDDTELTGEIAPVPAAPVVPAPAPAPDAVPTPSPAAEAPAVLSGEIPIVTATAAGWDMVPTTLPTYVSKPAAHRRTVSTIDLDSTGVWSSGRHDGDSALAREAEQAQQAEKTAREDATERRATGS